MYRNITHDTRAAKSCLGNLWYVLRTNELLFFFCINLCLSLIKCVYITVWCRRTDELVDGPNASHITPKALDRWEKRLNDLFDGQPYDMYDAALADTVSTYPVDIQVSCTS